MVIVSLIFFYSGLGSNDHEVGFRCIYEKSVFFKQLETWIRQEFNLLQASLIEKAEEQRNESSAYIDKRASVMIEGKSLTYRRKRIGPRTVP